MTRTDWLIEYILGPCRCSDAYACRGLTSPSCQLCNDRDEARDALLLAYQLGHCEAGTEYGDRIAEHNRDLLTDLFSQMMNEVK